MRIQHLKSLGQKQKTMNMLDSWIDDNIDVLYKNEALKKALCSLHCHAKQSRKIENLVGKKVEYG